MSRKAYSRKQRHLQVVSDIVIDTKARKEGPKRKSWTHHDMRNIKPITETQEIFTQCYYQGSHICGYGSAGTGKTLLSIALGIIDVLNTNLGYDKMIIVRSNVATRDVGFLPGTLQEKMEVYEAPYKDIFSFLFGRATTYDDMKEAGILEFMPTSFVRGLTWDNAIVIVDECQNMTLHEINSIMTRLGENTRVILVGDCVQTDLRKSSQDSSGFKQAINIFQNIKSFSVVKFTDDDIVRSGIVKEWIVAHSQAQ